MPKSVMILNHKPHQRQTAPTNQKHLSCESCFRSVCEIFATSLSSTFCCVFFFSFLQTRERFFLSLWKPSVRIFNTWPHQNPNHIRERGGRKRVRYRGKQGRRWEERERESVCDREWGRMANTEPHQTAHPISER